MKIPLYEMWIRNLETSIQRASSSDVFVSIFSTEIARASGCTANRVIATGTTPSSELSTMIFVGNCKQLHHLLMESDVDTSATNRCLIRSKKMFRELVLTVMKHNWIRACYHRRKPDEIQSVVVEQLIKCELMLNGNKNVENLLIYNLRKCGICGVVFQPAFTTKAHKLRSKLGVKISSWIS